ncbi:hypothetical protein P8C59_007452 [Phyllachora maydis]|uniref:Probable dipeptidyl-aminopeptidase B n=1 Tax=Phyllachora maydis TaxID=1825666 RepID=A0AAD9MDK1_9PEZI|nr:hypothetical protein P8C59_007452 [Phyllachora maydis]
MISSVLPPDADPPEPVQKYEAEVLILGASTAGLRAAVDAHESGMLTENYGLELERGPELRRSMSSASSRLETQSEEAGTWYFGMENLVDQVEDKVADEPRFWTSSSHQNIDSAAALRAAAESGSLGTPTQHSVEAWPHRQAASFLALRLPAGPIRLCCPIQLIMHASGPSGLITVHAGFGAGTRYRATMVAVSTPRFMFSRRAAPAQIASSGHDVDNSDNPSRISHESASSASTTSLVFERIHERLALGEIKSNKRQIPRPPRGPHDNRERLSGFDDEDPLQDDPDADHLESGPFLGRGTVGDRPSNAAKGMDRGVRRILLIASGVLVASWIAGLLIYVSTNAYKYPSLLELGPQATVGQGSGKPITLDQVRGTFWMTRSHSIEWIAGADGEDGLLLEQGASRKDYLVVEDVRSKNPDALVRWSPTSDAIVFTRDQNLYLRHVGYDKVIQITKDGGADVFNGVPDWVYEEEVLAGAVATWWSADGNFIAFLRTNELGVPDYEIDYYVSRPSGLKPPSGEESYPEHRQIKYPKAGAHNPIVELKFYDVIRGDVFQPQVTGGFADEDRLVTTVVWAGQQALVKETNRVSNVMRVVLVDVTTRTGRAVRTMDVRSIDGGWFEISQNTRYVPADPAKGRPSDGYIDTIIHDNGDHLAYFTPMDNPEPVMLTSGDWEVENAPSAIDLDSNLVYFVATKESSIQRHVYQVKLTGKDLAPITDTTVEGYYGISFSSGTGFALLSYQGPGIPWQKIISTPSNPAKYELLIEDNKKLAGKAKEYELPIKIYGTVNVDGVELNYVERRPPHFDEEKKYPVLFHQYSGPGSQSVNQRFAVDFQSYVAAGLGYICVTVDGRGTGFLGRTNRVLVRENLGYWEAHDQIAAAQNWTARRYVDDQRLAIWGWSYGGFMTLKTLERDAGQTFRYGMAVAPVTDWRFYDSVYTERYMSTPQENEKGYAAAAVSNVSALSENVRFLLMHGVADDNVHFQNSLTLLDKLDQAGVENYDVHVFPDSDHSISFGNANRIVYDKLVNWLVNAFNGEWLKIGNAKPNKVKESTSQDGASA